MKRNATGRTGVLRHFRTRFARTAGTCRWLGLVCCSLCLVTSPEVLVAEEVQVEPARVQIYPGRTQQLLVTRLAATPVDLTARVEYHVGNSQIASVTSSGLIRAIQPGTTNISFRSEENDHQVVITVLAADREPEIHFETELVPVLTRLGCNGGGCHGKATGQNGFKLSLFGFESTFDYENLVHDGRGRRLFLTSPESSLLLLKATAALPHGGGKRLEQDSDDYRLMRDWIARGAPPARRDAPVLERIHISPTQRVLAANSTQQILIMADFSDGTSRDVTRQAVYQSNENGVATVDANGLVATGNQHGLVSIMARFGEKIATFDAAVPFQRQSTETATIQAGLDQLDREVGHSAVDRQLVRQWKRLNIHPTKVADDATFLRRVSIDVCGTLPTPKEIEDFLADQRTDKRARLVDRLLERPEYASYFTLKWADILQNRGSGYGTQKQRAGTVLFAGWIRDSIAANKPYDQFVSDLLTATGSQYANPPALWYRSIRKSPEYVESVAQAFMGIRIQCAQCHHHPTESWSQADYFGLAAIFARIGRKGGFADAEVPTDEIIYLKDSGEITHPRTGEKLRPRALGKPAFELTSHDDPRQFFAQWLTSSENPYFARTMVNRLWAHFMGRGIIHPIDDARSTNPPSNPELLDLLAKDFVRSGFDVKQLIRTITGSYAYGLETGPNTGESQSFARFYPRRLGAEVLLDAISQTLDVPTEFAGGPGKFPIGTRAVDLPDENVAANFLDVFGRPARMSSCECERVDAPALTQGLELVNSTEIQRKLTATTGYAQRVAVSSQDSQQKASEIFIRVLGRSPQAAELKTAVEFLESESDKAEACRSLLWSLMATNEFLFNH